MTQFCFHLVKPRLCQSCWSVNAVKCIMQGHLLMFCWFIKNSFEVLLWGNKYSRGTGYNEFSPRTAFNYKQHLCITNNELKCRYIITRCQELISTLYNVIRAWYIIVSYRTIPASADYVYTVITQFKPFLSVFGLYVIIHLEGTYKLSE